MTQTRSIRDGLGVLGRRGVRAVCVVAVGLCSCCGPGKDVSIVEPPDPTPPPMPTEVGVTPVPPEPADPPVEVVVPEPEPPIMTMDFP